MYVPPVSLWLITMTHHYDTRVYYVRTASVCDVIKLAARYLDWVGAWWWARVLPIEIHPDCTMLRPFIYWFYLECMLYRYSKGWQNKKNWTEERAGKWDADNHGKEQESHRNDISLTIIWLWLYDCMMCDWDVILLRTSTTLLMTQT